MKFNVIGFHSLFFFAVDIKINSISFLLIILKYGLLSLSKMLHSNVGDFNILIIDIYYDHLSSVKNPELATLKAPNY